MCDLVASLPGITAEPPAEVCVVDAAAGFGVRRNAVADMPTAARTIHPLTAAAFEEHNSSLLRSSHVCFTGDHHAGVRHMRQ